MYCNAQKPQYIELFQMLLTHILFVKNGHMLIFLKHPLNDVFDGENVTVNYCYGDYYL